MLVPLLLIIIIAILLFGSTAVIGAFGMLLGAIVAIGGFAYVSVHYGMTGKDWAIYGGGGMLVAAFAVWQFVKLEDRHIERQQKERQAQRD